MLVRSEPIPHEASSVHSDTRSKSGILTPASHASAESRSNARKRKRDDLPRRHGAEDLLSETFSVKPTPSISNGRCYTLKPLAILSRSDLPLSWLDRSSPPSTSGALPISRLYEASIKLLDLEQRMSSTPSVLIASLEDKKFIYAIEYESRGRYACFKLGPWVDLNKIYSIAVVSRSTSRPQSRAASVSTRGDEVFVDKNSQIDGPKFSKKKKLGIEAIQAMVKRPSAAAASKIDQAGILNPLPAAVLPEVAAENAPESHIPASQGDSIVRPEPTPEEVLDNIRSQYLENLYLSKASTAYFAKGPLSRARATYQLDTHSILDIKALSDFLKSLILPTTTLDKKYKDGVTEAVLKLEAGGGSDTGLPGKAPRKKRAPKKVKLGKNGLYTKEDALIQQWWENYDSTLEVLGTSRESVARSRISQLRIRETQLQMIVILETLQLEKMAPLSQADIHGRLQAADEKTEANDEKPAKTAKSKKLQDPSALINIHVDRLAIWQSISAEESKGALKSVEKVDDADKQTGITDKHAADILKDFCVEVIVPFFSARLPSICDTICRKLGGPKVISSSRPPTKKSATIANPAPRPGAATRRAPPRQASEMTLERLLTEDRAQSRPGSRGPSQAISLMRAKTMPGMKREESDTPSLRRIPSMDSQSMGRNGLQNLRKQREVDISFSSILNPVVKKANIERELKDAISALSKPNRVLAGQSIAELSEKRAAAAASQSRKAKKPVRNALFDGVRSQGVQIQATPRVNRHKDMMAGPQLPIMYGGGHGHDFEAEPSVIPPSSISRVPSSGPRLGGKGRPEERDVLKATPLKLRSESSRMADNNTPTRKLSSWSTFEQSISATPVRGPSFSQSMNTGFHAAAIVETVADTPVRPSSAKMLCAEDLSRDRSGAPPSPSPPKRQSTVEEFMGPPLSSRKDNIFETPQKAKATPAVLPATPDVSSIPLKPPDFGRRKSVAVPEGPAAHAASVSQNVVPPSSNPEDIYKALGWDDDDEL